MKRLLSLNNLSSLLIFSMAIFLLSLNLSAQEKTVFIDDEGVMRWSSNNEEIRGFGVNYTVPFAHAYRSAQKMGIDVYEAMDKEIYHFSRLGFDLYRVHVWDTEISDTLGNLLVNEHLEAFDYLLAKLSEHDIKYILTPIAFWGNGWPERDQKTPGFSHKYGKGGCLTDPDAISAQENYLFQFMNHTNKHTGITYKNDPNLIAIEISNEPHHRGEKELVRDYVSKMVQSVKRSGFKNPVFYNFSHGINYVPDYIAGGAEGGTFQWYPTGLGYQQALPGNFLPNVNDYAIPFDSILLANSIARIVYEFDGADIDRSYIYPAMARSFRSSGIQLATHFSYDPTFLAPYNTEYNTHYMNLAYTPHKALALMISAKVFKDVDLYELFCEYPYNHEFNDFIVDPAKDLAMYNTLEQYIYTNDTEIEPWELPKLKKIAGHGNSPVIQYDGTGAYFLDKIGEGCWRLEVMPDVLVTSNPYGRNSLDRKLASIQWNTRNMSLNLPELGQDFRVTPINDGNNFFTQTSGNRFEIRPGTYLLVQKDLKLKISPDQAFENGKLSDFFAPESNVDKTYVVHQQSNAFVEGSSAEISLSVISPDSIQAVELVMRNGRRFKTVEMDQSAGFIYKAILPEEVVKTGILNYHIVVKTDKTSISYPGAITGHPYDWDFDGSNAYEIPVIKADNRFVVFEPEHDWNLLRYRYWPDRHELLPTNNKNAVISIQLDQIHKKDNENPEGPVINDYTIRYFINEGHRPPAGILDSKKFLVAELGSDVHENIEFQIGLIDDTGKTFGKTVEVGASISEIRFRLEEFIGVPTITMPRPYPTFLPYYLEHNMDHPLDLTKIDGIQITVRSRDKNNAMNSKAGIQLGKIWFE
jgi:hypothetical protein